MAFNFPDAPTLGQEFGAYTWDGEKWVLTGAGAGGDFLPLTGGTLSGALVISPPSGDADLALGTSDPSGSPRLVALKGGKLRWVQMLGDAAPESGGNAGSDFELIAVNDAGNAIIGTPLIISRNNLRVTLAGDPISNLHAATKQYVDAAGGGGGGGLSNGYAAMTDGTNTAAAVGAGTFKLRSADPAKLSIAVANDDATHGDNALITANVRERLTAGRTYYVNDSGGLDSNNGLSPGTPFKTIQQAIDIACGLDLSIYEVVIRVADGTYTAQNYLKTYTGVGPITILGNVANPASVHINTASAYGFTVDGVRGIWRLGGMKITAATACLYGASNSILSIIDKIEFGAAPIQIVAASGAIINMQSSYSISAGGVNHYYVENAATLNANGITVTFLASVTFNQFAMCKSGGLLFVPSSTFNLGGFTVTGLRFYAANCGIIETFGAGANYLPGSVAGQGSNPGVAPFGVYS